jgi:hypothetical protein
MDYENLITTLSTEFGLSSQVIVEEIRFVMGNVADHNDVGAEEFQRVYAYFHSVYGANPGTGSQDSGDSFARLTIKDWRQFESIDIDLSARLTILTGENGTGKTTLLNLLGQAYGETIQFLGTPTRDSGGFQFRAGRNRPTGEFEQIGLISLRSGLSSRVGLRQWQGSNEPFFSPELAPYRSLPGLYLDAQRVIGPYQKLDSIPPRFNSASEIAFAYKQQLRNIWLPHQMAKTPGLLIKEALIAAALYGEGNSMVVGDPRAAEVWNGFQEILRRLFPTSLEFEGLIVDQGELILRTRSGPFALEAASGGIAAVMTLAWQIYLHAVDSPDAFTVCFDEPENHLHPSLQRTLLPALLDAFPNINFVVATHSPFVVTSTRDAKVFALRRNGDGLVESEFVPLADQAFSAAEVLDEVLGVGVTLPIWAERELDEILDQFRSADGQESVQDLVERLEAAGLRLTMPNVTEAIATEIEGQRNVSGN